jgi:uncharacterized membrane protein
VVSLIGFALIVWGFAQARLQPVVLWSPPAMLKHLNALFTLLAFIGVAAAYVPRNGIRARLHRPMVLGVKLWAFGHLLATGTLADLVCSAPSCCGRCWTFAPRAGATALGTVYAPGAMGPTVLAVVAGGVAWAVFAFWLHAAWIGVAPFPRA